VKFNDITAVVSDVGKDRGFYFRNLVVLMPCIRPGIAAPLASHFWNRGYRQILMKFDRRES
jgi:hypothetical protein